MLNQAGHSRFAACSHGPDCSSRANPLPDVTAVKGRNVGIQRLVARLADEESKGGDQLDHPDG
jgi:hypothetical protein